MQPQLNCRGFGAKGSVCKTRLSLRLTSCALTAHFPTLCILDVLKHILYILSEENMAAGILGPITCLRLIRVTFRRPGSNS